MSPPCFEVEPGPPTLHEIVSAPRDPEEGGGWCTELARLDGGRVSVARSDPVGWRGSSRNARCNDTGAWSSTRATWDEDRRWANERGGLGGDRGRIPERLRSCPLCTVRHHHASRA